MNEVFNTIERVLIVNGGTVSFHRRGPSGLVVAMWSPDIDGSETPDVTILPGSFEKALSTWAMNQQLVPDDELIDHHPLRTTPLVLKHASAAVVHIENIMTNLNTYGVEVRCVQRTTSDPLFSVELVDDRLLRRDGKGSIGVFSAGPSVAFAFSGANKAFGDFYHVLRDMFHRPAGDRDALATCRSYYESLFMTSQALLEGWPA